MASLQQVESALKVAEERLQKSEMEIPHVPYYKSYSV